MARVKKVCWNCKSKDYIDVPAMEYCLNCNIICLYHLDLNEGDFVHGVNKKYRDASTSKHQLAQAKQERELEESERRLGWR